MKNISIRFDSIKSYVPNILNSGKEKFTEVFTLMTQSESDFLTKAENTETDIKELLNSKMEIEVILGLKFIMIHILKGKDITKFFSYIVNLFSSTNFLIKKMCLNIIDHMALQKKEVLILLFNYVNKKITDTNPLERWSIIHLITSMKNQSISLECSKSLLNLINDSNPLIRRLSLISIVQYIKEFSNHNNNICITDEDFTQILIKFFNDPHPIVFSTAFYAICELKNKDYLNLSFSEKFMYFCDNLNKIDEFYYERVVFSLINFFKLFIMNNFDKNLKYMNLLFNSLYNNIKHSTNINKNLSSLFGIFEILNSVDKLKLNSISKEEFQLFKNCKQLNKIGLILIKTYLCAKFDHEKFLALDLINKFLSINIEDSYFTFIIENIKKHHELFYLKLNDKEYVNMKKLEILIHLADEYNIKIILDEFKRNLIYPNLELKKRIIKSIYHICKKNNNTEKVSSTCIEKLIDLLKLKEEVVISQIIVSLRKLILEIKEHTKFVLIYNIKNYKKNITSALAKANIIWMISQYIDIIPTVTVDFFRRLLMDLETESDLVKFQILGLAMRIYFNLNLLQNCYKIEVREVTILRIKSLINYSIEKLIWDKNYNIREKSRMVQFLIKNNLFENENYNLENNFVQNLDLDLNNNNNNSEHIFSLSIISKIKSTCQDNFNFSNNKFIFDIVDKSVDSNFYKISLDDIINFKKQEESNSGVIKKENKNDGDKYISVAKVGNVDSTIQNFSGGINVEELRQKMKNQLDDFLNSDEDDDEYEVEIKRE